ncbi:MAG: glycosyltransferase family 8 protein [Kiritimatiellia bacterium]
MTPLSISLVADDHYAQHAAVVMASIMANTPDTDIVFHIVHRNISEIHQCRLAAMSGLWPHCSVIFHLIDPERFATLPLPAELEHVTREMYFRYLLPELLTDERTLYLDVDILALGDLRPLWATALEGCILAGVADTKEVNPEIHRGWQEYRQRIGLPKDACYVNSGVLLMDLSSMRAARATPQLIARTAELGARTAWPDQDVLNLTYAGRIKSLSPIYNCTHEWLPMLPKGERPVIRHFANFTEKPWCCLPKNRTWIPYLHYLRRSTFADQTTVFIRSHLRGFFFYQYTKKNVRRTCIFGLRLGKRTIHS